MTEVTHQTIRLGRGRHERPEDGACVMELASMLGGEPFSDHPPSVCPVIGAFLRTYNDLVDDDRRQDLYRYAATVVGSRATRTAERERARSCEEALWRTRSVLGVPRRPWRLGAWRRQWIAHRAAEALSQSWDADGHARALALIDHMVATGAAAGTPPTELPRELDGAAPYTSRSGRSG